MPRARQTSYLKGQKESERRARRQAKEAKRKARRLAKIAKRQGREPPRRSEWIQ
jgi:hypothetical protein